MAEPCAVTNVQHYGGASVVAPSVNVYTRQDRDDGILMQPPADKRTANVYRKRDVRTYATLWNASEKVLIVGLREPKGAAWQFLSSIVLTAFAFEAYLNHIGPRVLTSWEELERLSPKS
jgi:hypothetical protein